MADNDEKSASSSMAASNGMAWPSVGTETRATESEAETEARLEKIANAVSTILECVGEDVSREGIQKTPMRYAKALMFFTKGYELSLPTVINDAIFEEDHDEMVIVKDIDVFACNPGVFPL
jgi:GTP cyclohydrolase IA